MDRNLEILYLEDDLTDVEIVSDHFLKNNLQWEIIHV